MQCSYSKNSTIIIWRSVPSSLKNIHVVQGAPGKLKVTGKYEDGTSYSDEFNTVIFAIGRNACTENIGLDKE